jgi:hypothetical protein
MVELSFASSNRFVEAHIHGNAQVKETALVEACASFAKLRGSGQPEVEWRQDEGPRGDKTRVSSTLESYFVPKEFQCQCKFNDC